MSTFVTTTTSEISGVDVTVSNPRPASNENRFILDVNPTIKWTPLSQNKFVIDEQVHKEVPQPILEHGVTLEVWQAWMTRFEKLIQDNQFSVATSVALTLSIVGIPLLFGANTNLQAEVDQFISDFNRDVMEPNGMFIKFQKSLINRNKSKEEVNWLAVALNANEVSLLKSEAIVFHLDGTNM